MPVVLYVNYPSKENHISVSNMGVLTKDTVGKVYTNYYFIMKNNKEETKGRIEGTSFFTNFNSTPSGSIGKPVVTNQIFDNIFVNYKGADQQYSISTSTSFSIFNDDYKLFPSTTQKLYNGKLTSVRGKGYFKSVDVQVVSDAEGNPIRLIYTFNC